MEIDLPAAVRSFQPTLTTTIYSAADAIGTYSTLALVNDGTGTCTLTSLSAIDIKNKTPALDILFYSQLPGGTITDNSALSITAADHASYFLGSVSIAAADWRTQVVGSNIKDVTKLAAAAGLKLRCSDGTGLVYIILQCSAAPSGAYAAGAGDLTFRFGVDQD